MKGKLVLGIGLPASGKTTLFKEFSEKYGYEYLGVDETRQRLGVQVGMDTTDAVWDDIHTRTKQALQEGKTVVIDSTFATVAKRRAFAAFARANGATKVHAVFVDAPEEIARERNRVREEPTPDSVFDERLKELRDDPPSLQDGFDALFTLDEYQTLQEAETAERGREFRFS